MAKAPSGEKKKGGNFLARFGRGFARFFLKIGRSFQEMFAELKKVTWPSRKELLNYTLIVIAFILVMGVVIYAIDMGASELVQLILPS